MVFSNRSNCSTDSCRLLCFLLGQACLDQPLSVVTCPKLIREFYYRHRTYLIFFQRWNCWLADQDCESALYDDDDERVYRENNRPSLCVLLRSAACRKIEEKDSLFPFRERLRLVSLVLGWFYQLHFAQKEFASSSYLSKLPSQIITFGSPTMLLLMYRLKALRFPLTHSSVLLYAFPHHSLHNDPCIFPFLLILLPRP